MPSFSSASFTSSTLLGRTMLLMSFMISLQHALQVRRQLERVPLGQLGSCLRNVKHVDGPVTLRRNQDQVDFTAVLRNDAADPVEQPERVVGDDVENRIPSGCLIVTMNDGLDPGRPSMEQAVLASRQPGVHGGAPGDYLFEHLEDLVAGVGIEREKPILVRELEHVE